MEKNSRFEVYQDARSDWRWKLRGGDGSLLATSGRDGYATKQNCLNGLVAVKRLAGDAEIVERGGVTADENRIPDRKDYFETVIPPWGGLLRKPATWPTLDQPLHPIHLAHIEAIVSDVGASSPDDDWFANQVWDVEHRPEEQLFAFSPHGWSEMIELADDYRAVPVILIAQQTDESRTLFFAEFGGGIFWRRLHPKFYKATFAESGKNSTAVCAGSASRRASDLHKM